MDYLRLRKVRQASDRAIRECIDFMETPAREGALFYKRAMDIFLLDHPEALFQQWLDLSSSYVEGHAFQSNDSSIRKDLTAGAAELHANVMVGARFLGLGCEQSWTFTLPRKAKLITACGCVRYENLSGRLMREIQVDVYFGGVDEKNPIITHRVFEYRRTDMEGTYEYRERVETA